MAKNLKLKGYKDFSGGIVKLDLGYGQDGGGDGEEIWKKSSRKNSKRNIGVSIAGDNSQKIFKGSRAKAAKKS